MKFPFLLVMVFLSGPLGAVELKGRTEFSGVFPLNSAVSGVVSDVLVQPGQRVKRDQLLLKLDDRPFQASVAAAKATVTMREPVRRQMLTELEKSQELYDRGVLATVELDHAQLQHLRARTALEVTGIEVSTAEYRLEKSKLVAPFAAWVIAVESAPGQVIASVMQPPTLLVLGAAGKYLARARVTASTAARTAPGATVQVTIADTSYPGVVRSVGLEPITPGAGDPLYPLDVEFASSEALRVGGAASVELP